MKKINKQIAKKLFNSGKTIYLFPYGARMSKMWTKPMPINKRKTKNSFTTLVNSYQYYNCNPPYGKHAEFYIK